MDSSNALGISIDWITKPFEDAMDEIKANNERTTMYALRETGRQMSAIARSRAPVYRGSDPRPVRGALRRAIKNDRTITGNAETGYELRSGVVGGTVTRAKGKGAQGVPLYASKMEEQYGFMAAAFGEGGAVIAAIWEDALAKALAEYS